tara:strand:+ start:235 stop:447 length:213 start_codon:yes stop_codon:yes gene_type:complete
VELLLRQRLILFYVMDQLALQVRLGQQALLALKVRLGRLERQALMVLMVLTEPLEQQGQQAPLGLTATPY